MEKPSIKQFVKEVRTMRMNQKSFFSSRDKVYLKLSIEAEKKVDAFLLQWQKWEQFDFTEKEMARLDKEEKQPQQANRLRQLELKKINEEATQNQFEE